MVFESVLQNGDLFFKDEHGVAEVLIRREKRMFERPGKRPGRELMTMLMIRCPTCGQYREMKMVGIVSVMA